MRLVAVEVRVQVARAACDDQGVHQIQHATGVFQIFRRRDEEHRAGAYACVMHCYSSGPELAKAALDLGFYLSMTGIAAFPKSRELRDIFAAAPVDRILVETDAPYLAPPPHRGRRNEPAYVAHTAKVGAEVYGLSHAEFAARTEANFERLFSKAAAAAKAA